MSADILARVQFTPCVKKGVSMCPVRRFWEKAEITETCWIWHGCINDQGYAQIRVDGKTRNAAKFAFEQSRGQVPEGLVLDHLCRVRHCVNPRHLEPVTNKENILRGISPPAQKARKTHCKRGHEFSLENTRHYDKRSPGGRTCFLCTQLRRKEGRA